MKPVRRNSLKKENLKSTMAFDLQNRCILQSGVHGLRLIVCVQTFAMSVCASIVAPLANNGEVKLNA